ncbi:hypothetical protein [Aegicerativicinus sediminis]|uniref:hypothetical protein n=1 Tax=Aegicerativicinus sediminis TaxID=2893202 RepID=UPI001E28D942|nr:hypothetical protein [Aegicerativicinus sediminis]
MKEDNINRLIERYKSGETSLEEEKILFEEEFTSDDSIKKWIEFAKRQKQSTPENFNDTLWESFQKKKQGSARMFATVISVAASIILLLTLVINKSGQAKLDYAEKQALLEEARSMFKESQSNIIYEDEFIQIYTTSE